MAPVAFGALAWIAGMVVISVFTGAVIGAAVWRLKSGLIWGAACVAVYLLVAPKLCDAALVPFARLNASPLILTFLSSYLAARRLRARGRKSAVWVTVAGFGCGLAVALLYMILFRALFMTNPWRPVLIAFAADVCLVLLAIRTKLFA